MVDFILFQGSGLHQAVPRRCRSLFRTSLDWHLLKAIVICWDPALRCITIEDVDLVLTLEEYDHFLSLSTLVSRVYRPPT